MDAELGFEEDGGFGPRRGYLEVAEDVAVPFSRLQTPTQASPSSNRTPELGAATTPSRWMHSSFWGANRKTENIKRCARRNEQEVKQGGGTGSPIFTRIGALCRRKWRMAGSGGGSLVARGRNWRGQNGEGVRGDFIAWTAG